MQTATTFHEDIFYAYFRPFRHPLAHFQIWGGHGLETFGADLQIVQTYPEEFVWTVVDGCVGPYQWIIPGFHYVNRICYLLTELPHHGAPVEFRTEFRPRPLTHIGFVRRMNTLRRLMVAFTESLSTLSATPYASSS